MFQLLKLKKLVGINIGGYIKTSYVSNILYSDIKYVETDTTMMHILVKFKKKKKRKKERKKKQKT